MKNNLFNPFFISIIIFISFLSENILAEEIPLPLQIVQKMSLQLEDSFIKNQDKIKVNSALTSKLISNAIGSNVNFTMMSQYILGRNWKKATAQQKQEFISLLKSLLIRLYSRAFNDYLKTNRIEKGMITFLPYRSDPKSEKRAKIKTEIKLSSSKTKLKVFYSLYKGKTNGWKIYDLSINGLSLVTTYRSTYNRIIKKKQIAGLINCLKEPISCKKKLK